MFEKLSEKTSCTQIERIDCAIEFSLGIGKWCKLNSVMVVFKQCNKNTCLTLTKLYVRHCVFGIFISISTGDKILGEMSKNGKLWFWTIRTDGRIPQMLVFLLDVN